MFPRAPVIPGPRELVRQPGERWGLAMVVCQCRAVRRARLSGPYDQDGRCGKRPAPRHGAALRARGPASFAPRRLGAVDQPAVGHKVLDAGQAREVLKLRQNYQRQALPAPRHGVEPSKSLPGVGCGTARTREFHRAEHLVVVLNEGHLPCTGLAQARIGKGLCHAFALGLVRQLFADLRQMGLTSGMVQVGAECGALAPQVTAPAESVARRPHLRGLARGLGAHAAPKEYGTLGGGKLSILGFAPVAGCHSEGMP